MFRADGTLRDGVCYAGGFLKDCPGAYCHKTNTCQGYEAFLRRDDERKAEHQEGCECARCELFKRAKYESKHAEASKADPIDLINRPSHYITPSGLESVDVLEAFELNFHRGTVVTYILRAGRKGGPAEELKDLQKAQRWLGREINRLQGRREW